MTEEKDGQGRQNRERKKRGKRSQQVRMRLLLVSNVFLFAAIVLVGGLLFARWRREKNRPVLRELVAPDWYVQDFLDFNPYSRSGEKRTRIDNIVVHYVANKGTTAKNNRDYFNNMEKQPEKDRRYVSSHFIIGIDGEIIQCIPLDEVANANAPRNEDTVSIECCHPDDTGEFSEATKQSLYRLAAWLCEELNLTEQDVIRHYDVNGKNCPKFYVEHEDAWESLKKEMKNKRKES